jgi:hypothetical protein
MPPQTPVTADKQVKGAPVKAAAGAAANGKRQPTEESMWLRYSPHHEFPLSSVTSVGLHVLILILLIVGGWVAYKLGFGEENKPPDVSAVVLDGGGGGNKHGAEGGVEGGTSAREDVNPTPDTPPTPPTEGVKDLTVPDPSSPVTVREQDNNSSRTVQADKAIERLNKMAGAVGDKGRGGTGTGGGRGTGEGTGVGAGKGNGRALSERERQMLRWVMAFKTQNGEDYLRQLRDLKPGNGAILAVPLADGQFEIIRDLSKRPAVGQVEDVKQINRIFWIDDKPDSVAVLARTLQIHQPPYFVAFFPVELEEELKRIEREAGVKKYGNKFKVDNIQETKFSVGPDGRPRIESLSP